jgi:hypothetical protein
MIEHHQWRNLYCMEQAFSLFIIRREVAQHRPETPLYVSAGLSRTVFCACLNKQDADLCNAMLFVVHGPDANRLELPQTARP